MSSAEVSTLEIQVRTTDVEKGKKSLLDLGVAAGKAEAAMDGVESGSASAGASIGVLGAKADAAKRTLSAAADEVRNMARAATDLSTVTARMKGFEVLAGDVRSVVDSLQQMNATMLASAASQASAVRAADDYQKRIREEDIALRAQTSAAREAARAIAEKAAADTRAASAGDAFIAGLRRQAETLGFSRQQLMEYQAAQLGVGNRAAPFIAQLAAADKALMQTGMSAGQTAQAIRMLPAQLTDVATQLAGGQNPFLILLQQGGQVKDSFGGLGPMFRSLGGLITPTIALIGASAAGVGTLGVAYFKGRAEGAEFTKQIILTGNSAGVTTSQLGDMAASIGRITGSQSGAAEALAQLAGSGKVAGTSMEAVARAAELLRTATGKAVSETVAEFVKLADDPARASAKLNESLHYLTASTYEQIAALEKAGDKDAAAALAQRTYAEAVESRANQVKKSLGTLESAWAGVAKAASIAWNSMLDIGRADTDSEMVKKLQSTLDSRIASGSSRRGTLRTDSDYEQGNQALRDQIALLQAAGREKAKFSALDASRAAIEQASIDAQQKVGTLLEQHATKQQRMNKELTDTRRQFDAIRTADPFSPLLAREAESLANIRKAYRDDGAINDSIDARVEAIKRAASLSEAVVRGQVARETALYRLGAQTELSLIEKVAAAELRGMRETRAALVAEGDLQAKKQNSLKAVATVQGQIAQFDERIAERQRQLGDEAAIAQRKLNLAYAERVNAANEAVAAIDRQILAAEAEGRAIGATAAELARLTLARTAEAAKAVEVAAIWSNGGDELDAVGEAALKLSAKLQTLGKLQVSNDVLKGLDKYLDPDRAFKFGDNLASSLGRAGDAMQDLLGVFSDYAKAQRKFDQDRAAAASIVDPVKQAKVLAAIEEDASKAQIQNYASMAGAAKNFFDTNSTGYRILRSVEAGFTAFQLAQNVIKGASLAAVGVANQAQGEPYSAWARMAAMAAAMGALGFAVTGGFSGGSGGVSAADRQATQGRGTVLGDAGAQSDSIARAFDSLQDSAKLELTYQSGMLAALRSIQASMAGLSNIIVRTLGLTSGNALNVQTGVIGRNESSPFLPSLIDPTSRNQLASYLGPAMLDKALGGTVAKLIDNSALLGFINKIQSAFSKTTAEITDSGLVISGIVRDLQAGKGVSQYADVKTETKYLGFIKGGSDNRTVPGAVDEQIARQFGLVFTGISDALEEAAKALGRDGATVGAAIEDYFLEIPRASLRGLSGSALQEAVDALISTAADQLSSKFVPGLEDFQQIGEGLFQTVLRVATGVEDAQYALEKFGLKAVGFADIIDKQSDVSGEIVRQSIVAAEKIYAVPAGGIEGRMNRDGDADRTGITDTFATLSGVGKIIQTLSGSASDIAAVYEALLDVRNVLKSVGETGLDLSQAMLRGAGGLDALKSGLDAYLSDFFSASEQSAAATARLADEFVRIGVVMPATNKDFRALVESIDTSSEAGQTLYGQVISLAGSFADLTSMAGSAASALDQTNAKRAQEIRIMELTGNDAGALAARRADELAALAKEGYDADLLAQQRLIHSLEDAATAAAKAAAAEDVRTAAANAAAEAALSQKLGFERQILELQGDTAGLRSIDLKNALNDENRGLLAFVHTLSDAKVIADEAKAAEAQRQSAIESQTRSLTDQIYALAHAGDKNALRAKELSELADKSLEPLLRNLHALQDEAENADIARRAIEEQAQATARLAEEAARAAETLESQKKALIDQIFSLENAGNIDAIRAKELSEMESSLRPFKERINALVDEAEKHEKATAAAQALADAAAQLAESLAEQAKSLNDQIFQLENANNVGALRERELLALHESLRPLQQRVDALLDEAAAAEKLKAAADERYGLQTELLNLLGDTASIRARELELLDPTNRALKAQVFALQDQQAAATAAQQAAEQAAQAAAQLVEAWSNLADGITAEVNRIRGSMQADAVSSLAGLQAQFAVATAQTRAGDQAAAGSLPGISQAIEGLQRSSATSAVEFQFAQAQMAASLATTADIARRLGAGGGNGTYLADTPSMPSYTIQQPQTVFVTSDPAAQQRIASLEAEIVALRSQFETVEAALVQIAANTGKTARTLDNASNGDSWAMSTRQDDAVSVKTTGGQVLDVEVTP